MEIPDPEKAALTAELKAIETRLEKAAGSEKEKLGRQYAARVAHLKARLNIDPPAPPDPAPKAD